MNDFLVVTFFFVPYFRSRFEICAESNLVRYCDVNVYFMFKQREERNSVHLSDGLID